MLVMRLTVAAVGQRMPSWVQDAWMEYARRFPRNLPLELKEIPLAKRSRTSSIDTLRSNEAKALLASVPARDCIVALDERGKQWSTVELASQLERWKQMEHGVSFLVGGPDGLAEICREQARHVWALGRLTLPHPMVRMILAEQLYRAYTITQNHPYHRS
jgi:23S rRNA (pseudouridine1915-N3)-methyltransferase